MYWGGTASGASGALSKDEDCPAAQVGGAIASLTFGRVLGWVVAGVGTGSCFPGYPADPDARPGTKDDPGPAGQPGSAGDPGTRVAKYKKCSRRGRKGKEKKGKRRKREDERMSLPLERLRPFSRVWEKCVS